MGEAFAVDANGAHLVGEWLAEGDRSRPLVLIHGFSGSRHDWAALLTGVQAALPSGRAVLAYDQRGFGESTGPEGEPFSHAEDLLGLLDALGIAAPDVCGMSLGGATALNFALNYPARLNRLILVSPLIVGWGWSEEWVTLWKAMGRAARAGDFDAARALWWDHPLFETARNGPNADMLRRSIAAFRGQQWVQDYQRPEAPDSERLPQLSVPTLLLLGTLDMPDFLRIGEIIAISAPDVTRVDYSDAGHMLNLERPAEIAAEIARFLDA